MEKIKLFHELEKNQRAIIASYAAASIMSSKEISNIYINQYDSCSQKIRISTEEMLSLDIPGVIALSPMVRTNGAKVAAIIYSLSSKTNTEVVQQLAEPFLKIKGVREFLKSFSSDDIEAVIECVDNADCMEYFGEKEFDIGLCCVNAVYVSLAYLSGIVEGEKVTEYCENWEKAFNTMTGPYYLPLKPQDELMEGMSGIGCINKFKKLSEYWTWWDELAKKKGSKEITDKKHSKSSPFKVFYSTLRLAGISPDAFAKSSLLPKQTNIDAMRAVDCSKFNPYKESPLSIFCELKEKNCNEDTIKHAVKEALDKSKGSEPEQQKPIEPFEVSSAYSYALIIRALADKYVLTIKEEIKEKLFESETKSSVNQRTFLDLQRNNNKLENKLRAKNNELSISNREKKEAEKKALSSNKRANAVASKLDAANDEIEQLKKELAAAQETIQAYEELERNDDKIIVDDGTDDDSEIELTDVEQIQLPEKIDSLLNQYKITVVGGNYNLISKFERAHPDIGLIGINRIASCDSIVKNSDLVLFKTDSISHSLYNKCKQIAQNFNVTFDYIGNVASIEKMEEDLYKKITKFIERKETDSNGEK